MNCEAKAFSPAPWLFEKLKILMLDVSELPSATSPTRLKKMDGSMVSKEPTNKWGILGVRTHLLNLDPNFLGRTSRFFQLRIRRPESPFHRILVIASNFKWRW